MVKILRSIFEEVQPTLYLEAAEKIEKRIKEHRIETKDGIYWVSDEEGNAILNHYTGSAGIIRFYLELFVATQKDEYLKEAKLGGDYLIKHFSFDTVSFSDKLDVSLFLKRQSPYNQAEDAKILIELTQATSDERYANFARKIFDHLVTTATITPEGVSWSGLPDIGQDSGIVLLLLQAADYFNVEQWREVATKGAAAILSTEVTEEVGSRYPGYLDLLNIIPRKQENSKKDSFPKSIFEGNFFPNFSHGVSGTAYGFLKVYEATNDERFLEAAKRGAALIEHISVPIGEGYLVPYLYPNNQENIFYLSYCHGPAGTGRLFYELYQVTGDSTYLDFHKDLFVGVKETGAPELNSTGYWKNHSQCCGSAGLLHALSGSYLGTGDAFYLELAKKTAEAILSEAHETNDGLLHWYQNWTRTEPDNIGEYLGYGIGDAGLGSALLELYSILTNGTVPERLFDDPYPKELAKVPETV